LTTDSPDILGESSSIFAKRPEWGTDSPDGMVSLPLFFAEMPESPTDTLSEFSTLLSQEFGWIQKYQENKT